MKINELLKQKGITSNNDYSFLENDKETMDNLLFIVLGGSLSCGTEVYNEDGTLKSDIDIRAIRMNNSKDILLLSNNKIHSDEETDTTLYTINTAIKYFVKNNPNMIELLGNTDRNALYVHPYFKENILDNRQLFLSKNIYFTCGGFMKSQINRLNNKTNRNDELTIVENLMRSIEKSKKHIEEEFGVVLGKDIDITHIDKLLNVSIKDVSLNVLPQVLNELSTMCRNAKKLNEINKNQKYVLDHGRINKHMLHYIRLANMGIEILLTGEINTYREKDHDLLMSIRFNENGMWLDENDRPTDKLNKLIEEKENELKFAYEKSKLPNKPNQDKVDELVMKINKDIVNNSWK